MWCASRPPSPSPVISMPLHLQTHLIVDNWGRAARRRSNKRERKFDKKKACRSLCPPQFHCSAALRPTQEKRGKVHEAKVYDAMAVRRKVSQRRQKSSVCNPRHPSNSPPATRRLKSLKSPSSLRFSLHTQYPPEKAEALDIIYQNPFQNTLINQYKG